jgi:hypothetical protein
LKLDIAEHAASEIIDASSLLLPREHFGRRKNRSPGIPSFHTRDAIVDNYGHPLAIQKKLDSVHTQVSPIFDTQVLE